MADTRLRFHTSTWNTFVIISKTAPQAEGPMYALKYHPQYHNLHPYLSRAQVCPSPEKWEVLSLFARVSPRVLRFPRRKGTSTSGVVSLVTHGIARHEPWNATVRPSRTRSGGETIDLVVPVYILCKRTTGAFIFIGGPGSVDAYARTWRLRRSNSS